MFVDVVPGVLITVCDPALVHESGSQDRWFEHEQCALLIVQGESIATDLATLKTASACWKRRLSRGIAELLHSQVANKEAAWSKE